ncbi:hypothetical protein V9K67_24170 [Paraflavisolibacter sp. H34]|uniref:hypothetical protein n=1 Tax=Huijunlia imazamoxiresistens TaxID=3127457 RepID=UPI00301AF2D1
MKKYTFLLRLVALHGLLLFSSWARAQRLDSTLAVYAEKYGQERVYLHYDKSSYAPGETVWFKAYLMEGVVPAESSKTLYVDWVDDKGAVLLHSVSPIVTAVTNGQFDVPEKYTGSFIRVRAYTRWMLNFDTAFLYEKELRILSNKPAAAAAKPAVVTSVEFFPEGGDLVAGLKNRVAFKAADQWGRPAVVKGVIVNSKGVVQDSLRPVHHGLGSFLLAPQPGETYTARWKDARGAERTSPLPAAKPSGLSVQVALAGTRRVFNVSRTATVLDALKTLHLVGTMQQNLVFQTDIDLGSTVAATKTIPTESLPTGILTMTLFDASWNAVAERITFVKNEGFSFATEMNVQRWGLSKRAKDEIQITVPDSLAASLSVSVTDAAIERDSSNNIVSHLLLASEIKGRVYRPDYYFSTNSDAVNQQLDLVMLTHGWRRFKWEDVVKGKFPAITYPREADYLALSGKVVGVSESQLRGGGTVILIVRQKDSASRIMMVPVESNGNFVQPNFIFFDTLRVHYQYQKNKALTGAEIRFMTERLAALNYNKNYSPLTAYLDTAGNFRQRRLAEERAKLAELLKGKTLETVTVTAKTKSPLAVMDDKYTSGLFKGADAYQFDLVNDPASMGYQNIFQYLQGKVAGLQITTAGADVSMQWRGGQPSVYLDEVQTDVSMISSLPVTDVAYVKVFRPPFMGGFGGGNGAIAIYTRRGGDVKAEPGKGLSGNTIMGYTPIRQFYAPNYAAVDPRNEQRDLRTTLYWNPNLVASPRKRTITLSFYNNDISDAFRVVIEGMSSDGRLTHFEQIME